MLRTVSSIPMSASSPSKKEATKTTDQEDKTKTFLFNLGKIAPNENKKRKKEKEDLSSDDDSYGDNLEDLSAMSEDHDEAEKQLENLVFGSGAFMVDNMDKIQSKIARKDKKNEIAAHFEKKAAWHDDNDEEISGQERLSSKFTKYFGTPTWADLESKNKKKKSKKLKKLFKINKTGTELDSQNDDDDEDDENYSDESDEETMFKQTGNYLADQSMINSSKSALPKTNIDIKVCTDANKEEPHNARLKCVEFHPSARVMLTAGLSQTLTLFQIDGKKNSKIQTIFIEKFPIMTAHFTRQSGDEIIMGSSHNKYFYHYDMNAGKIMKSAPPVKAIDETRHTKMSAHFEISPDNRFIAFIGTQGQIHLFSVKSKEWINSLKINDSCNAITFSPDSRHLFAFGDDKDVHVFDMNDRGHRSLHKFTDYGCLSGTSIAVSNNSQFIATGCKSGVVNIYNLNESLLLRNNRNPKPIKSFMNLTTPCTSLKFNSTSEILAVCSEYSENACKMIHVGSMSVFANFPLNITSSTASPIRIPQCIDFSLNSGYFTIGNHKGNALLYRLKHYGSF